MANEKRLIDVNDAVKLLRGKCVAKYPNTFLLGILASASEVEQMPTVDAVEVVRCKDCKHYMYEEYCNLLYGMDRRNPCDFCSYGERKDNERKADSVN